MATKTANLLVTFDPSKEESAKAEIILRLQEIKETPAILKIEDGLAQLNVKDAKKAVSALKKIAVKSKDKFSSTFNWIPVEQWVSAKIPEMQKAVKEIQKGIADKEKWKLDLGLHKTELHQRDLIIKLTDAIEKQNVDLEKPDKIVKVEIVKDKAAVSLLKPDELLKAAQL
jgi:tRNA(Ser,Leu) C12 N-acetylase TAN1